MNYHSHCQETSAIPPQSLFAAGCRRRRTRIAGWRLRGFLALWFLSWLFSFGGTGYSFRTLGLRLPASAFHFLASFGRVARG